MTRMPAPPPTSVAASSANRTTVRARPSGPSATANVASSRTVEKGFRVVFSRSAIAEGYRKNEGSARSSAASGDSASSGKRGPTSTRVLITRRSRSGSMDGLVTWANRWRR
jgi:hypothetical protein